MPPKKRTTTRKSADPTIKALRTVPGINKIFDQVSTVTDNAVGEAFTDVFRKISEIANKNATSKCTADHLQAVFCGKIESQIAEMVTRQAVYSPVQQAPERRSIRASKARIDRSVKKEHEEYREAEADAALQGMHEPVSGDDDDHRMEVDDRDADKTPDAEPSRPQTPQIGPKMSDQEFEDVAVPSTLRRIQQMSISRKVEPLLSSTPISSQHATPRRNPTRELANPVTPRNVFPTTPGRAAAQAAPRTPHRVLLPTNPSGNDIEKKLKHADDLRLKIMEQKKEKSRKEEEKRLAVAERKREQDKIRQEKMEEYRKEEERRANFARQQKEMRSPTRTRAIPEAKTPSSKSTAVRKVFPTETVPTPGRGPAKRTRMEVTSGKGGKKTVAEPTVKLSPPRNLPRNTTRQMKVEPIEMEIDEEFPPARQNKPKAKAKRSQPKPSKSSSSTAASDAAAAAAAAEAISAAALLHAEQEAYLKKQAAEEKLAEEARLAEKQRRKEEKRLAEEKAEAARRYQQAQEAARLQQIQEEEAARLREQERREEAELKATLERQAEKKARQEALGRTPPPEAYEMTPPRTYQARSRDDYGLHDLNSDDETDQEDDPRKEVPEWADFAVVRANIRKQIANPPFEIVKFFGEIEKPDLKLIFGDTVRTKKRGSSAVWNSSPSTSSARRPLHDISE